MSLGNASSEKKAEWLTCEAELRTMQGLLRITLGYPAQMPMERLLASIVSCLT